MYRHQQKDDDRRAILKNAQRAFGEVLQGKDSKGRCCAGKKGKQAVMHKLLTPCAKPKELDAKMASYFCENGIASKLRLPQVSL